MGIPDASRGANAASDARQRPTMAYGVWISRHAGKVLWGTSAAGFAVALVVPGVLETISFPTATDFVLTALVSVVLGLPLMFVAVRCFRTGLMITPSGVVLRGVLSTHEYPVADVLRFQPVQLTREALPYLMLTEDRGLPITALQGCGTGRSPRESQKLQQITDRLNQLLADAKAGNSHSTHA